MRTTLAFVPAVVAVAAASLAPANAQMPNDFEVRELEKGDAEVIQAVRPFADCLVDQNAKQIPKYLGSLVPEIEWVARDMAKAHPDCPAPRKLGRSTTTFLQAALLEALIRRDFANTLPPANFNHLAPFLYVKNTDNDMLREMFANLIDPYDCVSRREPAKVRALLVAPPLSTEEGVAFGGLKTTLVACHPKGEKWEMHAYFARRYLAETYYTLMKVDQRAKAGKQ